MDDPVARLRTRYPGIAVTSEIQAHVLLDEFNQGVAHFQRLSVATGDDYRWLGICHFSLFEDGEAISAYEKAIARGCQAARINMAHSLAFVDRSDDIASHLEQVNFEQLSVYDRVLYLRVKSLHDERNGQLQLALRQAEHAWRIVQGAPEFQLLAPQLLNQLGILHGRIGRSQRALWYLDRNLELSSGEEQTRVQLTRVRVLSSLGLISEARAEFENLNHAPDQYRAVIELRAAEISWAEGNIERAIKEYENASQLARSLGQGFEDFQASLDLAVLASRFRGIPSNDFLLRAQVLISDQSDRLLFRFREILLFFWEGRYTAPHAAEELSLLSVNFGDRGLLQEQGWVDLHLASLLHKTGKTGEAFAVLDSLTALAITLQNPSFLIREWQLLPDFRDIATVHHPSIVSSSGTISRPS